MYLCGSFCVPGESDVQTYIRSKQKVFLPYPCNEFCIFNHLDTDAMSTSELKTSIVQLLQTTGDNRVLRVVHDILLSGKEGKAFKLSQSQEQELDKRRADHKAGRSRSYTWEEVRKNVRSRK